MMIVIVIMILQQLCEWWILQQKCSKGEKPGKASSGHSRWEVLVFYSIFDSGTIQLKMPLGRRRKWHLKGRLTAASSLHHLLHLCLRLPGRKEKESVVSERVQEEHLLAHYQYRAADPINKEGEGRLGVLAMKELLQQQQHSKLLLLISILAAGSLYFSVFTLTLLSSAKLIPHRRAWQLSTNIAVQQQQQHQQQLLNIQSTVILLLMVMEEVMMVVVVVVVIIKQKKGMPLNVCAGNKLSKVCVLHCRYHGQHWFAVPILALIVSSWCWSFIIFQRWTNKPTWYGRSVGSRQWRQMYSAKGISAGNGGKEEWITSGRRKTIESGGFTTKIGKPNTKLTSRSSLRCLLLSTIDNCWAPEVKERMCACFFRVFFFIAKWKTTNSIPISNSKAEQA